MRVSNELIKEPTEHFIKRGLIQRYGNGDIDDARIRAEKIDPLNRTNANEISTRTQHQYLCTGVSAYNFTACASGASSETNFITLNILKGESCH